MKKEKPCLAAGLLFAQSTSALLIETVGTGPPLHCAQ